MNESEMMKKPTYDELVQAYNNVFENLKVAQLELQAIKSDKVLERLSVMMRIVEKKEDYPDNIVNLAIWHMKQILAKPKKNK